ncbi:Glycine cleavage system transcriptional antiactivator GcvR [Euzebya pacifica]|uniref:Glycine cleavage system transcriptional antiactivator GcvR n=2 Tax=Euzebya pacifica TaxID=1608957 RepID=A0A346XS06_9ACTN|nr:Glycine cleavage system transcriptional antiactivator GcvR [Euzebya pacifica]
MGYGARMESFVLSMIGADRAGLVEALAEVVADHGGSWERSQVTEMAGVFAGVVLVRLPAERSEDFRGALEPLHDRGLLDVTVRPATVEDPPRSALTVRVEVVGADRPGIVHDVSRRLASLGVGIVDLRTWTEPAAMAETPLFKVAAVVRLPEGTDGHDVTAALEDLSGDLMVDVVVD